MSHSYSSSNTYFTSGETAPSAEDAFTGAPIPNDRGTWALTEISVITSDPSSKIELDITTEPPTLKLKNVGAAGVWGAVSGNEFVAKENDADAGYWIVSGDYTGPGSVLEI